MEDTQSKVIAALMEQMIETGPNGLAETFTALFNLAMKMERDAHLGAGLYERSDERQGYANGYKPKTLDTQAGTVTAFTASRSSSAMTTPGSVPPGALSSLAPHGNDVSSIWPKTPSTTPRLSPSGRVSETSCARSGMPRIWPPPKPN